ncbi:hypothetical protein CRG98_033961 [Punica granatum]|uniref:Uncharacterized protein n=1 Tax=Punica granatum TaxID=22663 RepID=A0A2I0INR7_PUNGR|nr:hypothetical protein CRG98_033961 [Punica granatum]
MACDMIKGGFSVAITTKLPTTASGRLGIFHEFGPIPRAMANSQGGNRRLDVDRRILFKEKAAWEISAVDEALRFLEDGQLRQGLDESRSYTF